ncbi:N-acetyltransferase [Parasphingopyxis algicola]|uniref:N-acetyltransferase n=1 Tax=Parasphingopyxis algicola TaxID=2026624 RepID=UPI0015A3EBF8|nr:N-acetyltransferase [Parasphingopyxis algicola]QLC27016.1 N-acetyltransferase [Parasphingopyxis algicola]
MMSADIAVRPVTGKAELKTFVDLAYRLNADTPYWVPPLRSEVIELLTPGKNPFYEHADVQPLLAWRDGKPVGRISAHIDHLALEQPIEQGMGPGTGNWGMMEAEDEAVMAALLAAAEDWLRGQGMTRALGPLSLSVWDEPGLLTKGHDHRPMIMMGHHKPAYAGWIEACGHTEAKQLHTFIVPVADGFPPIIRRIVQSGERNERINIRPVDMRRFDEEATLILSILNQAWSKNWGFVPITDSEVHYIKTKLKPVIYPEINLIAEYDGKPAAFMLCLPDVNEALKHMNGSLLPFGWAKLLWKLKRRKWKGGRVPLMGVLPEHQNSRLASQLAFMMIEHIRRWGVERMGVERAEVGWILDDNQGMVAIADAIKGEVNRVYSVYEKAL